MINLKLKTKNDRVDLTLSELTTLRQSFIVASLLIISGYVLAAKVHPSFIFLPLLPAFGLLLSGLTGVCPMVLILQKMPWNKK